MKHQVAGGVVLKVHAVRKNQLSAHIDDTLADQLQHISVAPAAVQLHRNQDVRLALLDLLQRPLYAGPGEGE